MKTLLPGTAVSILPEFRDSPEDAANWRVVEDRGERVLIEATDLLLAGSHPQTVVGREMIQPAQAGLLSDEAALCAEYNAWLDANGLPHESADELLALTLAQS